MTAAAPATLQWTVGVREWTHAERDKGWGKLNSRFTAYVRDIDPTYCMHDVVADGRKAAKWLAIEDHRMNCLNGDDTNE